MSLLTSAATRHNAVDSAFVVAGTRIQFGQAILWNPAGVFDHEAVHIDHPKGAIRAGANLHRPEPVVGGSQKFGMLLFRRAPRAKCDAVALKKQPMDEIVNRFTNKCVSRVLGPEKLSTIDLQSASRGGPIGGVRFIEAFQCATRWIELVGVSLKNRINPWLGRRHVRIAPQVMFGHRKMPDQRAVIATEPVTKIIAHSALLAESADRLEVAAVRLNPKIATAQFGRISSDRAGDGSSKQTRRSIDPAIEAPRKPIHAGLEIMRGKS